MTGAGRRALVPEEHWEERAPESASTASDPGQWSLLKHANLVGFQDRWDELQAEFVEKPEQAALDAEDLIHDIAAALADSTARRRYALAQLDSGSVRFPEELWITLQRCRTLMALIQMTDH